MNHRQKLVQQQFLNREKEVIDRLEKVYTQSQKDINEKVKSLEFSIGKLKAEYDWLDPDDPEKARVKSMIQSKIYQKNFQEQLKGQVDGILEKMQTQDYAAISDYLDDCYNDGFIGAIFDQHGQGVPFTVPIDQESMVRAVQLDSKISQGLYTRLGEDVESLKKKITANVSRAISTGMTYAQTAQVLAGQTKIGFNRAARIARTEGHRIQNQATMDAMGEAKDRGAEIVKQWDATLDAKTRESHAAIDMQIRELNQKFGNGLMFPGDPAGGAAEVVNCRCRVDQRARWALEGGFTKMNNFTKQIESFESPEDYEEFKKAFFSDENRQYMNYVGEMEKKYGTKNFAKVLDKMDDAEYKHYSKLLSKNPVYNIGEAERAEKGMRFAVKGSMLESRSFADKFKGITSNPDVNKEMLENAKEILHHRSGQNGEDLYLYNTKTKKWYKSTSGTEAGKPDYTPEIVSAIENSKRGELIAFHNHPSNMPPSDGDINGAFLNGYKKGYILCHNGKVYEYTPPLTEIGEGSYTRCIAKFKKMGYNEQDAQLKAMERLSKDYGFSFKEVK